MKMIKKLINLIYVFLGFFATSPVLCFHIGSVYISWFTIFLSLAFVDLLLGRHLKIVIDTIKLNYIVWSIFGIISSIFGYLYFADNKPFQSESISYVGRILSYVFLAFLLWSKSSVEKSSFISKGILIGVVINVIVAIIDAVFYYTVGFSLLNMLFADYIEANNFIYGISQIEDGAIRAAGFNRDPASIGLFCSIITAYALYKKQFYLIVLSFVGALASVSVIAIAGMILLICIHFTGFIQGARKYFFVFISVLVFLTIVDNPIKQNLQESMKNRIEMKKDTSGDKDNRRAQFWIKFIPAIIERPYSLLIGTGYGTAISAYQETGFDLDRPPADVEMFYFSYFFDIGFVGLMIMLVMYFKIYKKLKRMLKSKDSNGYIILVSSLEGIALAAFGYFYTMYSVIMLITICSIDFLKFGDSNQNHSLSYSKT